MPNRKFRIFATADIGDATFHRLRQRGYEVEIYPSPEPPPKSLIIAIPSTPKYSKRARTL